ncbi:MAG: phytanoyl-CoA dioxygenase family protein [Aestuariibacter sp.]
MKQAEHHNIFANAQEMGFVKVPDLLSDLELADLRAICTQHHQCWQKANQEFYQSQAVNSAYLSAPGYLNNSQRLQLLRFVSSDKLIALAKGIIGPDLCFMNTQLFFNPVNASQRNYWHRDPQYHLNEAQQKELLVSEQQVWHFRIALYDEPGIEIIPNSHRNWDNEEERVVRLELDGHKNNEALPHGESVPLQSGEICIFSALAIHRGLYGGARQALDILYCSPQPELTEHIRKDCLPAPDEFQYLDNPQIFTNYTAV